MKLTADGAYEIVAEQGDGPAATATVRIDTVGPSLSASLSPNLLPASGPVQVDLTAADVGIGTASISYRTDGAETTPQRVVTVLMHSSP